MQGYSVNICKINVEKVLINSILSNMLCFLRGQSLHNNDIKVGLTDWFTLGNTFYHANKIVTPFLQ